MSDKKPEFDFLDPTGFWKSVRGDGMDAWAKAMVQLVNTSAYAEATGRLLDGWLTASEPMRKLLEATLTQTLANLHLPSREDINRLAERFTNIEMRLDDLDAKLDEVLRVAGAVTAGK
jgi:hypothetical protein